MGRFHLPIFLIFVSHQAESIFVVDTSSGKVQGGERVFEGIKENGTYYSFQGIPYAEPPIGLKRFKEPVQVEPWSGVKDVSGGPPEMCPQLNLMATTPEEIGKIIGKEDCLFLNIYTEEIPTDNFILRPVMFYIHGGGFAMGSGAGGLMSPSNSGEDYLLESGMVVVTINYRLGPLGFLAIEGTDVQGNQGLKDQLLALRWIKKNIVKFGGDPGRITISGLSAGGVSVHAHVLSPMGKDEDLFQGAISQSGTMLLLDGKKTLSDNVRFFENLCVNDTISEDLSDTCLFHLTPQDLVGEALKSFMLLGKPLEDQEAIEKSMGLATYLLWPIVDDFADNPFLPADPITILHNKQQKMVPYMSGLVKDEGGMLVPRWWKDMDPLDNKLQKNWGYFGAKNLFQEDAKDMTFDSKLKAKMVAHFYVGEDGMTRDNKQGLMDMITDVYFAAPNTEAIKLHAMARAPVYNYLFTYKGSVSLAPFYGMGDKEVAKEDFGVVHGDDIFYMFKHYINGTPAISTADKEMVEIYQKVLTNFARYGNPTPLGTADIPVWHPAQESKAACVYMELNSKLQEKHRMFPERMTFWNLIKFKDKLEKFAIDEEEEDLLDEIETTISEVEEELEDESNEDMMDDDSKGKRKRKNRRKKGVVKKKKQGKWKKLKQKKLAKRKRLAKKLRNIQCA